MTNAIEALDSIKYGNPAPDWLPLTIYYHSSKLVAMYPDGIGYDASDYVVLEITGSLQDAFFFEPYALASRWVISADSDYSSGDIIVTRQQATDWGLGDDDIYLAPMISEPSQLPVCLESYVVFGYDEYYPGGAMQDLLGVYELDSNRLLESIGTQFDADYIELAQTKVTGFNVAELVFIGRYQNKGRVENGYEYRQLILQDEIE